ncbi:MAG TPA: hypothetical protein VE553_06875 [Candidatus Binatia bacterium]|nr:hypothetical protein [Candidatus Binatia bacterium]
MHQAIIDQLLPAFGERLGTQFLAAYSVPPSADGYFLSQRFESSLLLFFSDDFPVHTAREVVNELGLNLQNELEAPPFVFTPSSLKQHAVLFPLLAHHIMRRGTRLCGLSLPLDTTKAPHPVERLAFLISESIAASAALVPEKSADHALPRLQRLASQLSNQSNSDAEPAAELFARVQTYLRYIVDSLPQMSGHRLPVIESADQPNLLAFYEDQERLLVVIPPLSANLLRRIDWSALAGPMPSSLTTLNVATTDQLFLTIQAQRPMDYLLGSYRRRWGAELLDNLQVSARAVFRQAARKPSSLLVDGVWGAYLVAQGDEGIHRIIHDSQNRLLNIRLEKELLCRLLHTPFSEPPEPLPRRDEPLSARIDAIVAHLKWWTTHYLEEMQQRPAEQKLSPL